MKVDAKKGKKIKSRVKSLQSVSPELKKMITINSLTLSGASLFERLFRRPISELLIVRFSKFFFPERFFKVLSKNPSRRSWHHRQVSYKPAAVT